MLYENEILPPMKMKPQQRRILPSIKMIWRVMLGGGICRNKLKNPLTQVSYRIPIHTPKIAPWTLSMRCRSNYPLF